MVLSLLTSCLLVVIIQLRCVSHIYWKYPGCCGRLNGNQDIIRYMYGRMDRPSKPLPPPPRSLWKDPTFVFSLKWASWMSLYIGYPLTLVRKGIGNEELMSISFDMVMLIETQFFYWSLVVWLESVRKQRKYLVSNYFL